MKFGKAFNLRTSNCYTFVQETYPELPDIKYKKLSADTFLFIALENGFHLIDLKDVETGDVFITNEPVHLMIYLGNNKIAHHQINKLSMQEIITEDIINNIKYTVRRN